MPPRVTKWIMQCVTTVTYSIQINGHSTTPFKARRGVRQGDTRGSTVPLFTRTSNGLLDKNSEEFTDGP